MTASRPDHQNPRDPAARTGDDHRRRLSAFADALDTNSDTADGDRSHLKTKEAIAAAIEYLMSERSEPARETLLLDAIRDALIRLDIRARDFDANDMALPREFEEAQAGALIVAAIRANELELVEMARKLSPITQSDLHQRFADPPGDTVARDLERAINQYARNERVVAASNSSGASRHDIPRLVIHAGATKTGSTILQSFLDLNRPELFRKGIWVPEVGWYRQPGRPHKQAGHSRFTEAAVSRDQSLRTYIEYGLEEVPVAIHTILLSSEAFFLHDNSHLIPEYLGRFPTEVLIYLRRQDEWANSQYCELVGGGATRRVSLSFQEWTRQPHIRKLMDYRNVLNRFASSVGKENVKVRVFDRSAFPRGDVIFDFADALGLPDLAGLNRPRRVAANDAQLATNHIEAMRAYNGRDFESLEGYLKFVEDATKALQNWQQDRGIPSEPPDVLSTNEHRTLIDEFAPSNASIARDWLGIEDGQLFDDTLPKTPTERPAISRKERIIFERAYDKWSTFDPRESSTAESGTLVVRNYGVLGWRLWGLTPVVRHFVRKHGTPQDIAHFDRDPSAFVHTLNSTRHRRLAKALYPTSSVLGPQRILRLFVPPIAFVVRKLAGKEKEADFRNDPVLYLRRQRNPLVKLLGRIVFPLGEARELRQRPEEHRD